MMNLLRLISLLFPICVAAQALAGIDADSLEGLNSEDKRSERGCAEIRFGEGCFNVGFHAGYGIPFHFDDDNTQVEDSVFVALIPRGAVGLTDTLLGDHWLRGSIELGLEGHFLIQTEPHSGSAWGVSLLFRYNFLASDRFVPFVEVGGALIDLDFDIDPPRADGVNFALQGSVGVHWFVSKRTAITAQWRYHHISNGRVNEPNVSLDHSLFMVGTTFFMD